MDLTLQQVDDMISQRVAADETTGMAGVTSPFRAAMSLLADLGPEQDDEIEERRVARAYLVRLVDELPAD